MKEEQEPGLKGRVKDRGFKHRKLLQALSQGRELGALEPSGGVERNGSVGARGDWGLNVDLETWGTSAGFEIGK